MQSWYSIISKNPTLSIYIWVIFCILPFFFIIQSFSFWQMVLGTVLILFYFICHRFSFLSKSGLVYMWISFQMILNIVMTLMFGYVYLSLFTAFFIGNIRRPVGFFIMYGLHIGFTVLSIVVGYFIYLDMFLSQTPFIIIAVIGVVLLPFTLFSKNKQENLEGQLESARERISQLVVHEERQRIARDLHDTLGQKLSMIGLKSDLAVRLVEKNPEQAILEIRDIRQTASIALKEVRELVANIRSVSVSEELIRVKQMLDAAEIDVIISGDDVGNLKMPTLSESVVAMCLKEAVNNIVRHSKANHCLISITQSDNEVQLVVYDDGVGFNKDHQHAGNGLKGMRERLEFINGTLEINQKNTGTELVIHVPVAITHQKRSGK
jgi:two-component system, NarL family, sensor histidine kinase DesK